MSGQSGGGISQADNEMAGRLLLVGLIAVVGVAVILVSPVLILGMLIGLIFYGAWISEGGPSGKAVVWPVVITLALLVYFFGIPLPLSRYLDGVLLTDFSSWTERQVGWILMIVNEVLPGSLKIKSVTVTQFRYFGWSIFPVSLLTFGYLANKGSGKGQFLYEWMRLGFAPLRRIGRNPKAVLVLALILIASRLADRLSPASWVGGVGILMLLFFYNLTYLIRQTGRAGEAFGQSVETAISIGVQKGSFGGQVRLSEDQINHHVHIVGASGFGKSVLLSHIVKERISSGSGLLFVDLKADHETIKQVTSAAKAAGRIDDLSIFSCGNPQISSPYNIVSKGTANQIKDRIMGALNWSEEYYKNEASSFLLKVLGGLTTIRDQEGIPFDLSVILECAENPKKILEVSEKVPESYSEVSEHLKKLSSHLSKPENHRGLQGLRSQIESLILSDFGYLLKANSGGIDLFEAIRSKKIVYVLLDSRTYGESSKALGRLILQDLKAASAKVDNEIERADRVPFTVVVDEFADMASEDFIAFLDRARSSRIGVIVAHQEIADLSRISPEFAARLMNSTSTLFAFLQKLPQSSELISGICGTRKTKEVTEQAQTDWLWGETKTGMKSIKEVDEFIIHPNVIRNLSVGECVMVQKYPKSKGIVLKVHPEVKDYISDKDLESTLLAIKARYSRIEKVPSKSLETRTGEKSTEKTERSVDSQYWDQSR